MRCMTMPMSGFAVSAPILRHAAALCAAALLALPAGAQEGAHVHAPRTDLPHLVVDLADMSVVSEALAEHPWHPASLTKLMTTWTVLKAIERGEVSADTPVTMTHGASLQSPSKMGYAPGTTFSLGDALAMLMIKSANDVAVAIAEAVGGSTEGFAARMNAEARALGMDQSTFVNAHGLPEDRQVTSARDMVLLIAALKRDHSDWNWLWRTPALGTPNRTFRSFNKLLARFPGATGMKTGFVCGSGFNLAASAKRDGRELVAVVLGRRNGNERAFDAARLLELSFEGRDTSKRALDDLDPGFDVPLAPRDMRPHVCEKGARLVAPEAVLQARFVGPPLPPREWLGPEPETLATYRIGPLTYRDPWPDYAALERIAVPDLKPPPPPIDDVPLAESSNVPTFRPTEG